MIYTYRRYCINLVTSFHEHLNSIDRNILFTVEKESDGQLPFLDVLVMREEDGTISTFVYRKPTHTDHYLAFESHHPMEPKRAVIRTLMHRAAALCFSGVSRAQEEKHVQEHWGRMATLPPLCRGLNSPSQRNRDEEQPA